MGLRPGINSPQRHPRRGKPRSIPAEPGKSARRESQPSQPGAQPPTRARPRPRTRASAPGSKKARPKPNPTQTIPTLPSSTKPPPKTQQRERLRHRNPPSIQNLLLLLLPLLQEDETTPNKRNLPTKPVPPPRPNFKHETLHLPKPPLNLPLRALPPRISHRVESSWCERAIETIDGGGMGEDEEDVGDGG